MTHVPVRWFLPVLAIAGAIPFVSPLFAGAPFDPGYNPHASFRDASSCPRCHPVVGGKTDPDRVVPGSVGFCMGCHANGSLGRSHPVGARPRDKYLTMKVPGEFPLDDDGRMTCLTCHSAHGPCFATAKSHPSQEPENPDAPPGAPLYYKTRFVRKADPVKAYSALCYGCHEKP